MYDVILQPITSESNIPFKKVLLLSNGTTVTVGLLKGMNQDGYIFQLFQSNTGVDGSMKEITRMPFKATHYTVLNIELQ